MEEMMRPLPSNQQGHGTNFDHVRGRARPSASRSSMPAQGIETPMLAMAPVFPDLQAATEAMRQQRSDVPPTPTGAPEAPMEAPTDAPEEHERNEFLAPLDGFLAEHHPREYLGFRLP